MKTQKVRKERRAILTTLAAGGAAAAAAAASRLLTPAAKHTQEAPATAEDSAAGRGYRETAHVRKYYRTTQI